RGRRASLRSRRDRGHARPRDLRDGRPAGRDAEPGLDGGARRPREPRVLGPALPARGAPLQARGLMLRPARAAPAAGHREGFLHRDGVRGPSGGREEAAMSEVTFPENHLRTAQPELAERIEAEIRAAALAQGPEQHPLAVRILNREWNAPRGCLTIQLN